jgi:hypothetical protein
MPLDPTIALMGQQPDIAGAIMRGRESRMRMEEADRQNALRDFYQQQGPGLLKGDQNALSALAGIDPYAALGIQGQQLGLQGQQLGMEQTRLGMQSTRQTMAINAEQLEMARAQAARQAELQSAQLSEIDRQAEAENVQRIMTGATAAYQQGPEVWKRFASSVPDLQPYAEDFEMAPVVIATGRGTLEGLAQSDDRYKVVGSNLVDLQAQGGPQAVNLAGQPEFRPATPEEAARYGAPGGQFGPNERFYPINPPSGMTVYGPDGKPILQTGNAQSKAELAAGKREVSTDVIVEAADQARTIAAGAPSTTTGVGGQLISVLPSTQAAELRRQVDVLKSNASIENLTAMRQASPTGGGLGAITERENAMLAAAAGALDPNASATDFKRSLDNYEQTLLKIVHGPEKGEEIYAKTRRKAPEMVPEGVDPELWELMPPEDRALWSSP